MSNDNSRRKPDSGNRPQGAGRRVYPGAAGPRVGRIATNVPKARRVDAEDAADLAREDARPRGGDLHRGGAYRAPSGAKRPREAGILLAEDDGRILAGRNPIREALRAGRPVEKLLVADGDLSGAAREIIRQIGRAHV